MGHSQILVHGIDELKVILPRYIGKKGWLEANVATIVSAMTGPSDDFTGDWTPAKYAAKHPKIFRKIVGNALRNAKRYENRQTEKVRPGAGTATLPQVEARFTSMRF